MRIYQTKKTALRLQKKAAEFLNGITSNDIDKPNNAFLNINGRIIATFDQLKLSDDEVIMLIEQPFVDTLLQHIDRYVKLSGVNVEPLKHAVYFDLDGDADLNEGEWTIPQRQGRLVMTERDLDTNVSDEEFTLFRLENHISIHGIDYKDELLLNVSEEDFVSFTKGCYLGQEPISKVHSRSKPTWRLAVKFEDECTEEEKTKMTSKATDPGTGRTRGFVFIKNK